MAKPAQYALKLRLHGPGVRPGAIAVPDLLRICEATQKAVNRQAEALLGGDSLRPGPPSREVAEECMLELVGVGKGSTVLPFRFVQPQRLLPGSLGLGERAVRRIGETVQALAGRTPLAVREPGVLDSLSAMTQVLDGAQAIEWIVPARRGQKRITAILNTDLGDRIHAYGGEPVAQSTTVEGTLEMADFKIAERRCRIRPALGTPVTCSFDPGQAEMIQHALRKRVRASGQGKMDPETQRVSELALDSLVFLDSYRNGGAAFFQSQTLEQLAATQGVGPLADPGVLAGGWPEDEDLDGFLDEIYSERRL